MFDSLDDTIKHDVAAESSRAKRIIKWAVIAALSIVLFAGLIMAIRMME
jgi:hypothetical protein